MGEVLRPGRNGASIFWGMGRYGEWRGGREEEAVGYGCPAAARIRCRFPGVTMS